MDKRERWGFLTLNKESGLLKPAEEQELNELELKYGKYDPQDDFGTWDEGQP